MRLAFILLALVSTQALAQWEYLASKNMAYVKSSNTDVAATVLENDSNQPAFMLVTSSPVACTKPNGCTNGIVLTVNGKPVKFNVLVAGKAHTSTPSTQEGAEYIVKQFSSKNTVTIGDSEFDATGFNKTSKQVMDTIENAL